MRKARINISGLGAVVVLVAVLIVLVAVVVIVDATRTTPPVPPAPAPAPPCALVRHIVLPDACVCPLDKSSCPPTRTRPYLIFWTQAAACPPESCLGTVDLRNR